MMATCFGTHMPQFVNLIMQNTVYNLKNPFACSRKFHRQFKSYDMFKKPAARVAFGLLL
jgi:hypothetical protein